MSASCEIVSKKATTIRSTYTSAGCGLEQDGVLSFSVLVGAR
jgi:hypothetical protein